MRILAIAFAARLWVGRHGFEQRKDRAQGFSNARGRLRHQALAPCLRRRAAVDRDSQLPLASAKRGHRKPELRQRCIALRPVLRLAARPRHVTLALIAKKSAQGVSRADLHQHRLLLCCNVEVHQRHLQLRQAPCLAQQMAINLGLRPVQHPVVRAYCI